MPLDPLRSATLARPAMYGRTSRRDDSNSDAQEILVSAAAKREAISASQLGRRPRRIAGACLRCNAPSGFTVVPPPSSLETQSGP